MVTHKYYVSKGMKNDWHPHSFMSKLLSILYKNSIKKLKKMNMC